MTNHLDSTNFVDNNVSQLPAKGQINHANAKNGNNHSSESEAKKEDVCTCHQSQGTEIVDLISDDEFEEKPNVGQGNSHIIQDF